MAAAPDHSGEAEMTRFIGAICLAGLITTPASARMLGVLKDKATATIIDAQGLPVGTARITESKKHGLRVEISVKGQKPGERGVHLHTIGSCEGPKFTSAGPHWNPTNKMHGRDNPNGTHAGDLPNLLIGKKGRGSLRFDVPEARLDKANGLMDADGASIVVHALSDDHRTDPSGNSGDRVACGILRLK
jgi:superoxide dismutase, Cu-Zn family